MSMIALVIQLTNASRADVLRVAREGGTTAADWAIAHAIEQVTNRPAADIMWAGASRETRHTPATPPTNPAAKRDPEVTIYAEDADGLTTDTPEKRGKAPAEELEPTDEETVEELVVEVFSDLADLVGIVQALRITAAWKSPDTARAQLHRLVERDRTPVVPAAA